MALPQDSVFIQIVWPFFSLKLFSDRHPVYKSVMRSNYYVLREFVILFTADTGEQKGDLACFM